MDDRSALLLERARVATLGTIAADGRPHLIPIVFALDREDLVTAVDGKPKRSSSLARLKNLARDPRATFLAHHYEEDWNQLWWVRVDGPASIEIEGAGFERALSALRKRYPQYETVPLGGPVIRVAVEHSSTWTAGD